MATTGGEDFVKEHERKDDAEQTECARDHERKSHDGELTEDNQDALVPVKDSEVVQSVKLLSVLDRLEADKVSAKECRCKIKDSHQKLKAEEITAEEFAQQAEEAWKAAKAMMEGGDAIKQLGDDIEKFKEAIRQIGDHQKAMMELPTPGEVAVMAEIVAVRAKLVASAADIVADRAESVADRAKLVAIEAESVASAAGSVASGAELKELRAGGTHTLLYHLASLCNKRARTSTHSTSMSTAEWQRMFVPTSWPCCTSSAEKLMNSKEELELSGNYDDHAEKTLNDFSLFLTKIVRSAKKIEATKKDPKTGEQEIDATVNAIDNYIAKDSEQEDLAKAFGTPVPPGQEVVYGIPVPPGQDVRGVRPILTAIICKVASFVEASHINSSATLPSKCVQNEPSMEPILKEDGDIGEPRGKWRKVDAKMHKDQLRNLLPLAAAFQPLGRKGQSLFTVLNEGRERQVGRVAKRLMAAFNFGGVGVDGYGTGVIMTLASIEVVQLRFQRKTFSVNLRTTGMLPLFPKDCVEQLLDVNAEKHKLSKKEFVERLFSNTDSQDVTPAGLVVLWKLLNTPSHDLSSDLWEGGTYKSYELCKAKHEGKLGVCLGSGGFGMVYSVLDQDNLVVKVVQAGHSCSMENEIQVLMELQETCKHIPSLKSYGNVSVFVRGMKVHQTATLTSPRGDYNTHELALQRKLAWGDLCQVASDVRSALEHALGKGFHHLDVKPSNIVRNKDDNCEYYVLVDWGCARGNETGKGCVGTWYYAHSEIHENFFAWMPTKQFDEASLLYTLVVLYCRGNILWRHSGELLLENRKNEVDNIVKKWKSENKSLDKLEDLIDAANWTRENE